MPSLRHSVRRPTARTYSLRSFDDQYTKITNSLKLSVWRFLRDRDVAPQRAKQFEPTSPPPHPSLATRRRRMNLLGCNPPPPPSTLLKQLAFLEQDEMLLVGGETKEMNFNIWMIHINQCRKWVIGSYKRKRHEGIHYCTLLSKNFKEVELSQGGVKMTKKGRRRITEG